MTRPRLVDRLAASPANYWLGFVLDFTIAPSLIAGGWAAAGGGPLGPCAAILAGLVAYSFYEYALHRWLYHGPASAVQRVHAFHHRAPRVLLGAPFFFSLGVAALTGLAAGVVVGPALGAVFAGAVLLGYVSQSAVHHLLHGRRRLGRLLGRLRRHHLLHHGHGAGNYGVTTVWWDRLLGTELPPPPRPAGGHARSVAVTRRRPRRRRRRARGARAGPRRRARPSSSSR